MVHFYGSSVKQNMDLTKKNRNLDIFTGGEDLKKSKKEVGPLIIVIFIYYKVNAYRVIKKWIGITALKILKII